MKARKNLLKILILLILSGSIIIKMITDIR